MSTEKPPDPEHAPSEEVFHPVTGLPVTKPAEKLAILEDAYKIKPDGRIEPDWDKILKPRLIFRAIPQYVGMTASEANTYRKFCHEAFVTVDMILTRLKPLTRPRAADLIWERGIPIYILAGTPCVFIGDVVRALESLLVPRSGNDATAWLEFLKTPRTKGTSAYPRWKRAQEDPAAIARLERLRRQFASVRSRAFNRRRGSADHGDLREGIQDGGAADRLDRQTERGSPGSPEGGDQDR